MAAAVHFLTDVEVPAIANGSETRPATIAANRWAYQGEGLINPVNTCGMLPVIRHSATEAGEGLVASCDLAAANSQQPLIRVHPDRAMGEGFVERGLEWS